MTSWRTTIYQPNCACHRNRWRWEVEFTYPERESESGYARTRFGARFAIWRVERSFS